MPEFTDAGGTVWHPQLTARSLAELRLLGLDLAAGVKRDPRRLLHDLAERELLGVLALWSATHHERTPPPDRVAGFAAAAAFRAAVLPVYPQAFLSLVAALREFFPNSARLRCIVESVHPNL